jgi:NitT/TauT family transport system permease protein
VSDEKLLLMRTFGATKLQMLRMVILPGSVPSIISTIKINVGMTWVGVIVGEYLVSKAGLGYLIVYGGQVFKLDLVMASILILSVIAVLMYLGVAWVEKRYSRTR